MTKRRQKLIELFPKQVEFVDAVLSGKYSRLLYGGSIRSGKTIVSLNILFLLCKIYPASRWAIVRRDLPTLRRNTIPSFKRFKPNYISDVNQSTWSARCINGSEILFFPESLKDDPDLDRWKGLEVNGFVLEEANELSEKSYHKAEERAGSWKCPGKKQPKPLILMTCNPSKNWVKRRFYDAWKKDSLKPPYYYKSAKVTDNPHLTDGYLESLAQLEHSDPIAYKRFVLGDWEVADDPSQLIKYEWILQAKNRGDIAGKNRLGVDVARYGDDDTAFCYVEGSTVKSMQYHSGISIDRTAELTQAIMHDKTIDADHVLIDGVGIGAGVVDYLHKSGHRVVEVIAGARPIPRLSGFHTFFNLRSQLWWEFRERLRLGEISFGIEDNRLFEDLTALRYSVSGEKVIKIESKDDLKKRLGRSPDAGDAVVMAFAEIRESATDFVIP